MAKYSLIDKNDNIVGHVVIVQAEVNKAGEFQQVAANGSFAVTGPIPEAVLFGAVLGGFWLVLWAGTGIGWLSATAAFLCTFFLAAIRAWRGTIFPTKDTADPDIVLKGEFKDDSGTIYYDTIRNKRIQIVSLERICEAVKWNKFIWMGRPTMMIKARVSRTQYEYIQKEFQSLNYFRDSEGGKIEMSSRGRLFVHLVVENKNRRKH